MVTLVSGVIVSVIIGGANRTFKCSSNGSSATNRVTVTGAVRDGSNDDFAAIQNAINAAGRRGGGIVALPAGTFMINGHLVLKNNVKLTGAGPATIIKAGPDFMAAQGPGGGYPIISTAGASDTTISNLTADQSGNMLDGNVATRLSSYVVESRNSHNVVIDGVYTRNPFTYSIAVVASTGFCIENNNVQTLTSNQYDQLDGIHVLDSSSGQVINNFIQSGDDGLVAHTIYGPVHDVLYANNTVHGGANADGIQLAVGNFPIYNITIEDNDFYGSLFGIRTGYYDNRTGAVRNISISQNYVHNLTQGGRFPAIGIGGFGGRGPVENVTIKNNRTCQAGRVIVQKAPSNVVTGTVSCTSSHSLSCGPVDEVTGTTSARTGAHASPRRPGHNAGVPCQRCETVPGAALQGQRSPRPKPYRWNGRRQ
jgi:polygalacturonase